jgi:hypothetical protein
LRTITITGLGDFTIASYISATSVTVTGDAHTAATKTWSMTADGDYTLPSTFGGSFSATRRSPPARTGASLLNWTDESLIRSLRSNVNESTGTPSCSRCVR